MSSGRLPSKKGELCFNSSIVNLYKEHGFYNKETKEEIKGEDINFDKLLNKNIKIRSYKDKTYEEFKIVGFYTYIGKNTTFENFLGNGLMYKDDISKGPYESAFIEANDKKDIIDFYNKHCQEGKSRMYFYISYSSYAYDAQVEKITTFSILMLIIPAIIGFCGLSFSIVRGGIVQNRYIDFECLPKKLTIKEGNKIVFRNISYGIIGLLIGYFTSIPFTYMEMNWYTENVMRYFLFNSYYLYSSLIVLFYILLYTIFFYIQLFLLL